MTADYLDFQIEDDPEVLAQLAYDEMALRLPGWDPIVGEIDTAILQAAARIAAQVRASAGIVPIGVFRYLAAQFGLTPRLAQPASTYISFNAVDTAGYTVPAGTQVVVPHTDGTLYAFATSTDNAIIPGNINCSALAYAITPGAAANGIPGDTVGSIIDALPFIASIATVHLYTSSGGSDAQEDADFLSDLVRRFSLQSAAPILPGDFSSIVLDAVPPGTRAIAIDGWDVPTASSGNARTITVFFVDATGAALSAPILNAALLYLQGLREVNWNIYVASPGFMDVSVKYTAHAAPGYLAADVLARANAALTSYLSGVAWGTPALPTFTSWTLLEGWDKVRLGELYQVLNGVEGLAYVDTLFLKAGGALPTTEVADITLTGAPVVVPHLANLSGTVT